MDERTERVHDIDPHGGGGSLELTQDEMYREVGELYLTKVAHQRLIARLRSQLAQSKVLNSPAGDDDNADREPRRGASGVPEVDD